MRLSYVPVESIGQGQALILALIENEQWVTPFVIKDKGRYFVRCGLSEEEAKKFLYRS